MMHLADVEADYAKIIPRQQSANVARFPLIAFYDHNSLPNRATLMFQFDATSRVRMTARSDTERSGQLFRLCASSGGGSGVRSRRFS
jgi:hypothetical protein